MRPVKATEISPEDWELFRDICFVIENLPDKLTGIAFILGRPLPSSFAVSTFIPSCHMITRALAAFFPVEVHDGSIIEYRFFGNFIEYEHSWLTRKEGSGAVIFDPWPLGSLSGPLLTIQGHCCEYGNERSFLDHRYAREFQSQVNAVIRAIGEVLTPIHDSLGGY